MAERPWDDAVGGWGMWRPFRIPEHRKVLSAGPVIFHGFQSPSELFV